MPSNIPTMEPLSARIPSDLYAWLASLQVEGASTNSDKLRVLLTQLKKQYDGSIDYVAAHHWVRDLTGRLRDALVRTEGETGRHSEVMSALLEYVTSSLALMLSQTPGNEKEAARLEDALVKRAFGLFEMLLRQASTPVAAAYDSKIIHRHIDTSLVLAHNIPTKKGNTHG